MTYTAPLADMRFALREVAGLGRVSALPGYEHATDDTVDAVLEEAAKLAGNGLAPLNRDGDKVGAKLENGVVRTAPGFAGIYKEFVAGGWNSLPFDPEFGGQGMPWLLATTVQEMWQAANMGFGLVLLLNQGAIDAIHHHGSPEQRTTYLPKMISGEWTGTMNLTEPQAGSDLGQLKSRAVKTGDHYLVSGQKIFITYGEHDMAENIVHLVLARTPDAPAGVRGISRSLRHLAGGAEQLGIHMNAVPLAVAGPREIRSVTRAFNRMQDRLKRFVADRTQMLAAISHDLRTPLSRLRLRAEALAAGSERDRILADLALMDRMIAATLSFARDDAAREKRVMVDLASLVHSVCDEIVDAGGDATYQGAAYLAIEAAPLSLLRAVTNVIENAVKYGGRARVSLTETPDSIEIAVGDAGPGIPLAEQERVFEPFYRLDPARSPSAAAAGSMGLGLAIARHVLRAHGGDVTLANGDAGGLLVCLTLPRMTP